MSQLSRRRLLVAGGTAAGLAVTSQLLSRTSSSAGQHQPVAAAPEARVGDPFRLGVASGDPDHQSVVLWTRLAPQPLHPKGGMPERPVRVQWEIARDPLMRQVVKRGTATARPELAHSLHVVPNGLAPSSEYWYRFRAGRELSPIGRTKTLPHPHAKVNALTFALASCQHYQHGYYTAYRSLADSDPDLVLFLGDYIYEYEPEEDTPRPHLDPPEPVDLDGYRMRWGQYKADPDLQAGHAAAPFVTIWDDHDVKNDYAGLIPQPASTPNFATRRAHAYQVFYENLPIRRRGNFADLRIHHRFQAGRLATFSMLDTRQYRDDHPCDDGTAFGNIQVDDSCAERDEPARTILGTHQRNWLHKGLSESRTTWNLIGQQMLCAEMDVDPDRGKSLWEVDGWDGYPADRQRLLSHLQTAKVDNPVVLSGDLHSHLVADLKLDNQDDQAPVIATEFVTAGMSSWPIEDFNEFRAENPHVRYTTAQNGYLWMRLTPDELRTEVRVMKNRDGSLRFVQPDADCVTAARFVVENGRPGAQAV